MSDYIKREDAIAAIFGGITADREDRVPISAVGWAINHIPAADVVKVVRCKDCQNCDVADEFERWCLGWGYPERLVTPDDYCIKGR